MIERWPPQVRGTSITIDAIQRMVRRILLTSPTGSGKTYMMIEMLLWAIAQNWPAALFTNRKTLCRQTQLSLESHGIYPGMRAAGYRPALLNDIQLCMTQTEVSQIAKGKRQLHPAKLVLIDEAHLQKGDGMEGIVKSYVEMGAFVVGYTATPLDLGDQYDELLIAGKMSDCFDCKCIVPAYTYAPDEPDLKHIKKYQVGDDLSEKDNSSAMMRPGIFGRVYDHWRRLNPDGTPTILFAPGVKESLWFAEQFKANGVRTAHIDGSNVWLDGEYLTHDEAREDVIALVKSAEVPVICNRFVLREGIDIPELRHGILATVFGSLSSYLQSCGRLLRASEEKSQAVIQDHGGNWWRHGSVNADREWSLNATNRQVCGERAEKLREKKEREPITCPECLHAFVPKDSGRCPVCGHISRGKSRMVVQVNGELKPIGGDVFKERKIKEKPNTADVWKRYYYSQKRCGHTFNQAYGWFFHEERYWPPKNLPLMPTTQGDWFRKISDVPACNLNRAGGTA